MSEVVPLPSFGEVFFDERGQERVLRVTWHEGTLVLSLWRGEMCTASFRMPMDDVGRLVDTLDQGFIEAGGRYPDEADEQAEGAGYAAPGEFPGTGQYARPRPEDYAQPHAQPQPYADPAATQVSPPGYGDPALAQGVPPQEEPRQPAALGPNDVLVARGAVPAPDRFPERGAGYGPADAVPRENMIVDDGSPYGRPHLAEPAGPGDQPYASAGDPFAVHQGPDQYGASQAPDPFAAHRQPDPYGVPQRPAEPFPPQQADSFAAPQHSADPFAAHQGPDQYGASQAPDPFAAHQAPDQYGAPQASDPFAAQRQVDPFAPLAGRQRPVDPFTPHVEQFPSSAHGPAPDAYPSQGHSTDPFGFAAQGRQAGHGAAQADPYGYPPPAQPDPYGFPRRPAGQSAGHPADLRDLYGSQGGYDQRGMDPSDPLNFRTRQEHQPDQGMSRPYIQEPPHSTGERLRPEQGYGDRDRDRDDRRDW
ncbi:hypothetical protein ACFFMN_33085 [Planobispora siamensis]|uniref:Uncharacterized protein n=1 Tax=Planobispora siamensis TaxID=936338 RepID=A0A8J3WJ64_9ACTN|nr:hypothetical protein [Planobispora siamensis]GIH92599.1 hypothetical protein Psi01_32290 [Planobispora siamensis]